MKRLHEAPRMSIPIFDRGNYRTPAFVNCDYSFCRHNSQSGKCCNIPHYMNGCCKSFNKISTKRLTSEEPVKSNSKAKATRKTLTLVKVVLAFGYE